MLTISSGVALALATAVVIGKFATDIDFARPLAPERASTIAATSDQTPGTSATASERAAIAPPGEINVSSARVALKSGDTLLAVLTDAGISYAEAFAAMKAITRVLDPRRLKAGQRMELRLRREDIPDGSLHLQRLSVVPETDRRVVVTHDTGEAFQAETRTVQHEVRMVSVQGGIAASLYEAGLKQDVPMTILLQTYRTLGHAVDFQRDLHAGDSFALGYEVFEDGAAGRAHTGNLQYASLELEDRALRIYRYTTSEGYTGFFDQDGRSVEMSLMKTPVDGGELSSLFGKRDHPILGYTRMHKGVDFAAPRGAPVLAAGNGVVERRSRYGSFGKYIRLRHDGRYTTAYAHLSRYAKGLRPGTRVRQGEVIGYVGATGLATGPNLHYEILADGKQVNPMTVDLRPRRVLKGDELARFRRAAEKLMGQLEPEPTRPAEGNSVTAIPLDYSRADDT